MFLPVLSLGFTLFLTACPPETHKQNTHEQEADADADSDSDTDADSDTDTDSGGDTDTAESRAGTISGTVDGVTFDTVGSAWVLGSDSSASGVTLIISDQVVDCTAFEASKWDKTMAEGSKIVRIYIGSTTPGSYTVTTRARSGEAGGSYYVTSTTSTATEVKASDGSVSLVNLMADTEAQGTFDLTFAGGSLTGDFDAGWCPTGRDR
jgi:hypothetical protein